MDLLIYRERDGDVGLGRLLSYENPFLNGISLKFREFFRLIFLSLEAHIHTHLTIVLKL